MKLRALSAAVAAFVVLSAGAVALDLELSPYKVVSGLSGKLRSVGSDTMHHEMELWAEGFQSIYPNVSIELVGKGSNTAPPALLSGEAQLGPMSRQMTPDEIAAFQAKFGYKPTAVLVAIDALAVYVHKDNPLQCISMEQMERVFAADPKSGGGKSIRTWGELGLTGEWAAKPIAMYSRNTLSGTYKFFKQHVLNGADFKDDIKMQIGSEAVVSAVGADKSAIGYSGIGYKTNAVRAVPVAAGKACYDASFDNTYSRKYPLARGLYVYLLKDPKKPIDALSGEFVTYMLSRDGQMQAKKGGYYPITRNIREHELTRLGLLASAR
ncbi:phosphate ABC transporter substrate-binding protein [Methylocystis sp. L43]|uniref:PstS family phosphate ABC transporter substrate-binding protein n=1 Tax=unclassified Methylocystis TaxID=2625913 RepID=UPI0018C33276|nr:MULTISPECIES: phosphate ABC transporter substrate-binding protein [unclassified Methylocystis]MBG0798399.1 phosphate ABC transporter substrate-binding protein [Methylocystis sp. L43]MBG0805873.1 phosphate ABC transporter substrate-binding protein [Methylocystis sp. H15]